MKGSINNSQRVAGTQLEYAFQPSDLVETAYRDALHAVRASAHKQGIPMERTGYTVEVIVRAEFDTDEE